MHRNLISLKRFQGNHLIHSVRSFRLKYKNGTTTHFLQVAGFREFAGQGVEARVSDLTVRLGSSGFTQFLNDNSTPPADTATHIYVSINGELKGKFSVSNEYRKGISEAAAELEEDEYKLHLLSGDNDQERKNLAGNTGERYSHVFPAKPPGENGLY